MPTGSKFFLCWTLVRNISTAWTDGQPGGQKTANGMIKRLKLLMQEGIMRDMGLFSLEKRRLSGILSTGINIWWKGLKEPCSVESSDRTRVTSWNRRNLTRKSSVTVRVVKHWGGLYRGCELYIPGNKQDITGRILAQLVLTDLVLGKRLEYSSSRTVL